MNYIVNSLLDTDFYQISQANLIYSKHKDVHVKYLFKNRTKDINLSDWINIYDLEEQIDHILNLKFNNNELRWLKNRCSQTGIHLSDDFINALSNLKLPKPKILTNNKKFDGIEIEGNWFESIFWEVPILSVINQLFNEKYIANSNLLNDDLMFTGIAKLEHKISILKIYPFIKFAEFGTRRRFSHKFQDYIINRLVQEIPNQIIGTSNILFAKKYDIPLSGTMSHQLFMAYSVLYNENLIDAQNALLDDWWETYKTQLSIALIDTWGTDFFFKNFPIKHQINFWGVRQDSGDPFKIGEKVIDYYKQSGIDPMGKMLLFSDGLDLRKMIDLSNHFYDKIKVGYGWGTNLTNDVGGHPLSIVVKISEVNGKGTVKLSDNIAKSIGNQNDIMRYMKLAGYDDDFCENPTY